MTQTRPVALITGASSGVGAACAARLADDFDLALVARREDRLRARASAAEEAGARCLVLPLDVRDEGCADRVVASTLARFDRLDVVVAAAGHGRGSGPLTEPAVRRHLDDLVRTNLTAVMDLLGASVAALTASSGVFVAVGSIAGLVGSPGYSAYAATKHGLTGLIRSVRGELKGTRTRICVVHSGSINTEFASVLDGSPEPFVHELSEWGYRPLVPAEVADAIRWVIDRPSHVEVSEIVLRPTGDRDYA
ncbi:MAG: SDR family oxidoreductase [Frankiaceae bacterium]